MRKRNLPEISKFDGMDQFPKGERSLIDSERLGGHVRREMSFFRDVYCPNIEVDGPTTETLWEFTIPVSFFSSDSPQISIDGAFAVSRASGDGTTICNLYIQIDGRNLVWYTFQVAAGASRNVQFLQKIVKDTDDKITGDLGRLFQTSGTFLLPLVSSKLVMPSLSSEMTCSVIFQMNTTLSPPYTGNVLYSGTYLAEGKFGKIGG